MKYTLIILAGGQATRMGTLGKVVAKSSILISNTTLLRRQIKQALKARIKDIIVSTNETFYNQLKILTSDLKNVSVISNPLHKKGSMDALLNIIATNKEIDRVIMSFADIYFTKNPFLKKQKMLNLNETILLVAKPFNRLELSKGGIIFSNKGYATKIIEKPIPLNTKGYRWAGLAIFNSSIQNSLKDFLKLNPGMTEEDFFEHLRKTENIRIGFVPDFINVNHSSQAFLASLYQAIEIVNKDRISSRLLQSSVEFIRKQILMNKLPSLANFG